MLISEHRGQIIYGVLTITIGIVCWFFLIDKPKHRLLRLTEQEKLISDERTQDNAVVKVKTFKWYQIREALTEIRYYLMMLAAVCINLQNGGMLVFSTTFTLGLGFTVTTHYIVDCIIDLLLILSSPWNNTAIDFIAVANPKWPFLFPGSPDMHDCRP